MTNPTEQDLIDQAKVYFDEEKLFEAARVLRQVDSSSEMKS
jgi:hypothetical protein